MNASSDLLVDRRRLRRQLTFWRIAAVAVAIAAVIAVGLGLRRGGVGSSPDHVARIKIEGLITGKQETIDLLRRVGNVASAKALVIRINSGGGTTSGSETLFHEVRRLAEKKPVIAVIDGVGASGAYMTALGAERIVSNGSAIVGSVGVIAQFPNFAKLLDTLGVRVEAVRSTPLKAMPNGLEATTPEARAALAETVGESYRWFRDLVGERRKLDEETLARVTDGRVFTGRQALGLKLIDQIGGESEAIGWLESEKGLAKNLAVRDYRPPERLTSFPGFTAIDGLARLFGFRPSPELEEAARQMLGAQSLDGLVSLWQPSQN